MRLAYVVVKSGVYIQDVYGPFFGPVGLAAARHMGNDLASQEKDDYHRFVIRRLCRSGLGERIYTEFRGKNPAPRRVSHLGGKA